MSLVTLMKVFKYIFGLQPEALIIIILHVFVIVPCLVLGFVLVGIVGMEEGGRMARVGELGTWWRLWWDESGR